MLHGVGKMGELPLRTHLEQLSTVQANTAAGFSIVKYTLEEAHGLSVKPSLDNSLKIR